MRLEYEGRAQERGHHHARRAFPRRPRRPLPRTATPTTSATSARRRISVGRRAVTRRRGRAMTRPQRADLWSVLRRVPRTDVLQTRHGLSWSISAATAALWPCSSASGRRTSATPATTTSRG
uniref:Uncharacterized protein n=1 Tax=Anguilla anguilla TaxID=7936 RepID=A0A0E9PJJ1_ANGAN